MDLAILKQLIAQTPNTPGVYRFQDAQKQDIYIGKASSIRKRLVSYTKTTDPRIQKMITTAKHLTYIKTDSDIEALILESQLIKQHRPQFNIMLRDDKQYFFVGFISDEFPRLLLTHQPQSAENRDIGPSSGRGPAKRGNRRDWFPGSGANDSFSADFIGPFTDGAALKATLKYLRNIFPYCTCKQKHHNFCLNYHIGKCLGFCCIKNPESRIENYELTKVKKQYKQNIKAIKDILNGRHSSLVKELKKEMALAGKKHDFDNAIELRTKLERLERVFHNAQIIKHSEILKSFNSDLPKLLKIKKPIIRIEGYDISNIQGQHATGSMVTFVNGTPDKNYYRKFNIKTVRGANDTAMLREILERRLNHPEWPFPDLILIDGGKGQVGSAIAVLKDMGIFIPLVGLSKNEKHVGHQVITCLPAGRFPARFRITPLTKLSPTDKNLLLHVDSEAHRFAINFYRKRHRKSL